MKKKLPKLTVNKETLRNISDTQISKAAGGYSLGGTCESCNYSCDPYTVRFCPSRFC